MSDFEKDADRAIVGLARAFSLGVISAAVLILAASVFLCAGAWKILVA